MVACQNQRSQHANRDHAWKQLRAKLYELEMQKRNEAAQALEDSKSDIGWGSQFVLMYLMTLVLRTYVQVLKTQILVQFLTVTLIVSLKRV